MRAEKGYSRIFRNNFREITNLQLPHRLRRITWSQCGGLHVSPLCRNIKLSPNNKRILHKSFMRPALLLRSMGPSSRDQQKITSDNLAQNPVHGFWRPLVVNNATIVPPPPGMRTSPPLNLTYKHLQKKHFENINSQPNPLTRQILNYDPYVHMKNSPPLMILYTDTPPTWGPTPWFSWAFWVWVSWLHNQAKDFNRKFQPQRPKNVVFINKFNPSK